MSKIYNQVSGASKKKEDRFLDRVRFVIKRSNNMEYNIQAVAKMLGLPSEETYNSQCRLIVSHLNKEAQNNNFKRNYKFCTSLYRKNMFFSIY